MLNTSYLSINNSKIYLGKNCKMRKNNKYWQRRRSDNVSYRYSTNSNLDYETPNYNFFQHGSTSYSSNNFDENPQAFRTNSYRKNKHKSKNFTFSGSTSNWSFRNHEPESHNRKRKNSFKSNDFYMNKKSKYNDSVENLQHSNASIISSSESERLSIKPNGELFYFDVSGNKHIYNEANSPLQVEDGDIAGSFKEVIKSKKNKNLETVVDIGDCRYGISDSNSPSPKEKKKKKEKELPLPLENILHEDEVTSEMKDGTIILNNSLTKNRKSKKHKEIESLVDLRDNDGELSVYGVSDLEKKKKKKQKHGIITNNDIEHNEMNKELNITSPIEAPLKKLKKRKDIETLKDIRDNGCETSVNYVSNCKKKKKKHQENTNNDIEYNNSEKTNELDNMTSTLTLSKKLKKLEDVETLLDIRDNECDISVNSVSTCKKKKAHSIEKNTSQNKKGDDFNNVHDGVEETKSSTFKSPKKSKNQMVDVRDSDCEMTSSNISCLKKKKRHQGNTLNNIEKYNYEQPIEELNNDITTSVSSKKSKKRKALIDIRDSDCEMSVDQVSNRKKKKKKRGSIEEVPNIDESMSQTKNSGEMNSSSFKSPKKSKENKKTLVDIRDSDCEMSFSSILSHKKKKKKYQQNPDNDIIQDNNKQTKKEQNNDITVLVSPKKLKKHKKRETLVDIRDSDCEMSVEHRKKKKNFIEVGLKIEDTPPTQNGDDIGETESNSFSFKKERKHQANTSYIDETKMLPKKIKHEHFETVEGWDGSFGMSVSDACKISFDDASHKKKKKRHQESTDNNEHIDENIINTCNADIAVSLGSPKKLKKQRVDVSTSTAFRKNDCEMSFSSDSIVRMDNSTGNVNNAKNDPFAGVKRKDLKGTIYSRIYSGSSSEGYQSDSSEIMIPMKNKNESCTIDEVQTNYSDKDLSPKASKCKATISKFANLFEDYPNQKQTGDETSDLLDISNTLKEEPCEDDIETLLELNIVCSFPIPQLHSILTTSTTVKKEVLEKIRELNLDVKTGPFSKEEDNMILNNWKMFCMEYNLKINPSLFISFPRKVKMINKMNFLRYLARGLDNRLLHRVHARFKHLVQSPHTTTGRFTAEEDRTILEYINRNPSGTPYLDLSELLNRTRLSVLKRYSLLSSNKNKMLVKWTPELVEKFLSCMMEVTSCDRLKQLKRRKLSEKEWKMLSKKMDNIPVTKLQRGWSITIYPRLFAKRVDVEELKTIREDIIHNLYQRRETDWKTVNWKEVAKDYEGFTPQKIYTMFKHIVNYHVPKSKRDNLEDCLDVLENIIVKNGYLRTPHKFKKYIYEQGHVEYDR